MARMAYMGMMARGRKLEEKVKDRPVIREEPIARLVMTRKWTVNTTLRRMAGWKRCAYDGKRKTFCENTTARSGTR
jgi:hypothetical protein